MAGLMERVDDGGLTKIMHGAEVDEDGEEWGDRRDALREWKSLIRGWGGGSGVNPAHSNEL